MVAKTGVTRAKFTSSLGFLEVIEVRLYRGTRGSSPFEKALRRVVAVVEVIGKFGASRVKIERAIRT